MKLTIIRIEDNIAICELEGGGLIEISRTWFSPTVKENDIVEFDVTNLSK